jgi:DNA-3-methyladenine glycosylase I
MSKMTLTRCKWAEGNEQMRAYHDTEWGVPLHDDNKLFEFMILDAFQAGLSWNTVTQKRENFRKAFDNFDPVKMADYGEHKVAELMADKGIIRNLQKINASIANAKNFLRIQKEYGSFDKYIWQFTDGKTLYNNFTSDSGIPARTAESDAMSKALIKEGFKFVGSTICYAFMQAAGMVHDHVQECFRFRKG